MNLDFVSVRLQREGYLRDILPSITSSRQAATVFQEFMEDLDREVMALLTLDQKKQPINLSLVSVGTVSSSLVHPREIFKAAVLSNASSIIVAHNHPSGSIDPSKEDMQVTMRLCKSGDILGIPVIDHLIIGENKEYFSFAEGNIMPDRHSKEFDIIHVQETERERTPIEDLWQRKIEEKRWHRREEFSKKKFDKER